MDFGIKEFVLIEIYMTIQIFFPGTEYQDVNINRKPNQEAIDGYGYNINRVLMNKRWYMPGYSVMNIQITHPGLARSQEGPQPATPRDGPYAPPTPEVVT